MTHSVVPVPRWAHWARRLAVFPIRCYQLVISPLLGPNCRFTPTCSAYAAEAVLTHGILRGGVLAIRRLLRCHPWSAGGYDPVLPLVHLPSPSLQEHPGHHGK